MIVVGLTGGIGSGKTTVAKMFQALGIPIYIADEEAKELMNASKVIKKKLVGLFGENAYVGNELNRPFVADIIFKNKALLNEMNAIVHPKVRAHFEKWASKQAAPYVIKEAAILFENGGHKACDFIVTVTAPKELKVARLLKRDPNTTKKKIEAIMANQWTDEAKIELSHFVIENINLEETKNQVKKIHSKIVNNAKKC